MLRYTPGKLTRFTLTESPDDLRTEEGVRSFVAAWHGIVRQATGVTWIPHALVMARRVDGDEIDPVAVLHLIGHPGMTPEQLWSGASEAALECDALGVVLHTPLLLFRTDVAERHADKAWRAENLIGGEPTVIISAHHMDPKIPDRWWTAAIDTKSYELGPLVAEEGRPTFGHAALGKFPDVLKKRTMN